MNDALAGQLTSQWEIPDYAQNHLWLSGTSGSAQCQGKHGLFQLSAPESVLTLRWGHADGATLTQLTWQADTLGWDGSVRLGGMVEALHMTSLPHAGLDLAIVYFSGQPLLPKTRPFPDASQRQVTHFDVPSWYDGIDDEPSPTVVTLLAPEESALVTAAQDAMTGKIPVHIYGQLATEAQGLHNFFALPILWDAVTLFAS